MRGLAFVAERQDKGGRWQLVIDAEPYVADNEATRTLDLPARLKAEVERG